MPVVLFTTHGDPSAGYTYDDRTGVSYDYPAGRYESWIKTGERFVYIEGSKGYTGAGVIGKIRASATAGRMTCEVLDYEEFQEAVPIRDPATGKHLEADTRVWSTGNVYWSQGVRQLMPDTYQRVLELADATATSRVQSQPPRKPRTIGKARYGSPDNNPLVDAIAMAAALEAVRERFPGLEVERMPHENPGFDIRVGPAAMSR